MSNVKIADKIAWSAVPIGALVLQSRVYYLRLPAGGHCLGVKSDPRSWETWEQVGGDAEAWDWSEEYGDGTARVIALGLKGDESIDDLQRLVDVFEVWEAARQDKALGVAVIRAWLRDPPAADGVERIPSDQEIAERLHAAGWRPGMTAEDAARLLAGLDAGAPPA